jgi:hypothetical protein
MVIRSGVDLYDGGGGAAFEVETENGFWGVWRMVARP